MNGKKLFLPLVWLCVLGVLALPMIACSGPERETEQEVGNTEVETETETDAAGNVEDVEKETESDVVDADVDLDDAGITAKVKTKYAADDAVKAIHVNVDTKDGVVTLSGHAPDQAAKDKAEQLAKETEGVTQVVNNLEIGDPDDDQETEGTGSGQ